MKSTAAVKLVSTCHKQEILDMNLFAPSVVETGADEKIEYDTIEPVLHVRGKCNIQFSANVTRSYIHTYTQLHA